MKYCEHNRKSIYVRTLYGNFRTWSCILDNRQGNFDEPCKAACTKHFRRPNGERGHSFPYKFIEYNRIRFDDAALRQIERDKKERHEEAEKLRKQALTLIKQADKLDN